jgi:ribosomal protein L30/L7E
MEFAGVSFKENIVKAVNSLGLANREKAKFRSVTPSDAICR